MLRILILKRKAAHKENFRQLLKLPDSCKNKGNTVKRLSCRSAAKMDDLTGEKIEFLEVSFSFVSYV
jgi:predicted peroxiredoxin